MARPPDKSRRPSAEEADLWRRATEDTAPLRGRSRPPIDRGDRPPVKIKRSAPEIKPPPVETERRAIDLPSLKHDRMPGLDKRSVARLRRGQYEIDGRADLHGMTQQEAHRRLDGFIAGAHAAGDRCVLVITGKGLRPDGSTGILRQMVPRWLNESPNRSRILAFTHAQPKHGGQGALYVLLRRRRE